MYYTKNYNKNNTQLSIIDAKTFISKLILVLPFSHKDEK